MDDVHGGMEGVSAPGGNREQRRKAGRRSKRMVAVGSGAVLVAGVAGPGGLLTASVASAETFTVDSLADDGTGETLREAIEAANLAAGEDTITFAAGLSGTIVLTSDLPTITESLSILGPGADVLAVDGDGNSILDFEGVASGTSTISGLTLTGGYAFDGGAISFDSAGASLAVADARITGNEAESDGGGIAIDSYGEGFAPLVAITNTTISGNVAGDEGGGLYFDADDGNASTLRISGSSITGNTSYDDGGGVYVEDVSVEVISSTISGNTAGVGGGGGGVYVDRGSVLVEFSTVSGNVAGEGGGGLYFSGSDSYQFTMRNSTVSGNSAMDYGGGLYLESGDAVVENSTISGNTAYNAGAIWSYGYLTLIQSTVTDNTAAPVEAAQVGGIQLGSSSGESGSVAATKGKSKDDEAANRAAAAGLGEVELTGTIVAGNAGQDIGSYQTPSVTASSDHSIIGVVDTTVTIDDLGGTQAGVTDPGLAPLAANGGPTQTHALLDGSPALNAGPNPVPSFPGNESDQRGAGFARVAFGLVDVGAFEAQEDEPVVPPDTTPVPAAGPAEATVVTPTFTG